MAEHLMVLHLATFDCVITNPPFSLEKWGEEVWTSDPYGRNFAGMPPAKRGDYAWVQHMVRSMAPATGRMAVVLPAGILVFRQRKRRERRKKILILDASREFKKGRAQSELLPEHVERIYNWYQGYTDVEGIARVVTLDEIAANDHNLNIPRYIEPRNDNETLSVDEAMARLRKSAMAAFEAEERLTDILKREDNRTHLSATA